ncbi:Uncharacterized protein Adt_02904 [Abeliophyllum distichum]|uniref:Polyprotein n=1 Tax=Abeliophyllum distichum TaxID=126358 RepID=A0ABD1VXF0_9LAMI
MAPQAPQVSQAHQAPLAHHAVPIVPVIEQFHRYQLPTFDSGNDPLAAEEWLQTIEKFFSTSLVPKIRKTVVKMAQTVTFLDINVKVQEQQNDSRKKNWQDHNRNQNFGQFKRKNQGPIRSKSSNSIPQCPKCKKNHSGDYYFGKNV